MKSISERRGNMVAGIDTSFNIMVLKFKVPGMKHHAPKGCYESQKPDSLRIVIARRGIRLLTNKISKDLTWMEVITKLVKI